MSSPSPTPTRLLLLVFLLTLLGGGLSQGWAMIVQGALSSSRAQVVLSSPVSLLWDQVGLALLTGGVGLLAALLRWGVARLTGFAAWPLWMVVGALLVAENLAIALRLITLATLTVRDAVEVSAVMGSPPLVDLSRIPLTPWAMAGVLSGMVLVIGLLVVLSQLRDPDAA